jgi:tetratricopeptide (TPR) repeat protein
MSSNNCTGNNAGHITQQQHDCNSKLPYAISCSESMGDNNDISIDVPEAPPSESVCAFCKNDYGHLLNKLSVYPICDSCKVALNKQIFPTWVKLFFGGVLLVVVFSIFWNWRFYSAYINFQKANKAYFKQNTTDAAKFMTKAAEDVPETPDIAKMAAYFRGIDLLVKDKSTAALAEFNKCRDLSPDFKVNLYVLQAEMGSGYDKKDYKLFLSAAKASLQLDTNQSQSWAAVASAYACLYSQNNADSLKQLSLNYIHKAKRLDDTSATAKEFYGRVLYRLDSKQVISRDQFLKKFPKGYTSLIQ